MRMVGDLKPGDVVQLRCGGPRMVIARAHEPSHQTAIDKLIAEHDPPPPFLPGWVCMWTVQGALRQAVFPTEALRAVEASADP
jgi:uncharacterized protein YodC (DUF2158 family)